MERVVLKDGLHISSQPWRLLSPAISSTSVCIIDVASPGDRLRATRRSVGRCCTSEISHAESVAFCPRLPLEPIDLLRSLDLLTDFNHFSTRQKGSLVDRRYDSQINEPKLHRTGAHFVSLG
jgi:hypothetical protein